MRTKRAAALLSVVLCGMLLLPGCSFKGTLDKLSGKKGTGEAVEQASSSSSYVELSDQGKVDESLDAPKFDADLTGSLAAVQGSQIRLSVSASVEDGGTVSYQWYRNNVKANGGGTPIGGATKDTVTVDTSEAQTVFYYCVAQNSKNGGINMSVSGIYEIAVWPQGKWQKDDKGYRYVKDDGTYPADTRIVVDNKIYTLNTEGYRTDEGQSLPDTFRGDKEDQKAAEEQKAAAEKAAAEKAAAEKKAAEQKAAQQQQQQNQNAGQ